MSYGKEMPQGSKTRLGGTHTQSHIIVDDIDVGHETVSFRLGEKKIKTGFFSILTELAVAHRTLNYKKSNLLNCNFKDGPNTNLVTKHNYIID